MTQAEFDELCQNKANQTTQDVQPANSKPTSAETTKKKLVKNKNILPNSADKEDWKDLDESLWETEVEMSDSNPDLPYVKPNRIVECTLISGQGKSKLIQNNPDEPKAPKDKQIEVTLALSLQPGAKFNPISLLDNEKEDDDGKNEKRNQKHMHQAELDDEGRHEEDPGDATEESDVSFIDKVFRDDPEKAQKMKKLTARNSHSRNKTSERDFETTTQYFSIKFGITDISEKEMERLTAARRKLNIAHTRFSHIFDGFASFVPYAAGFDDNTRQVDQEILYMLQLVTDLANQEMVGYHDMGEKTLCKGRKGGISVRINFFFSSFRQTQKVRGKNWMVIFSLG